MEATHLVHFDKTTVKVSELHGTLHFIESINWSTITWPLLQKFCKPVFSQQNEQMLQYSANILKG